MSNLEEDYVNLSEEIILGSSADGIPKVEEFFNIFSKLASENGDCPDLEYCPISNGSEYRVDGYAFDFPDDSEDVTGDLYIAVCLFSQEDSLPTINSSHVEEVVQKVRRFLKLAYSKNSLEELEESSPAFKLSMMIRMNSEKISRVRVIVFTNTYLKVRKKLFEPFEVGGISVYTNVFDFQRYSKISTTGSDPVEINFTENFSGGIPCLQASSNATGYKSYLFAIPGIVLADIFAEYGNRLLEQNVRTYLQAKTNVNKGILKTIEEEPSMFFAYNNGLTATASAVETSEAPDGSRLITYIKDFQIVNGGQTTASILYARDEKKYDLSQVYAQVKLSVVEEASLNEVVPKISEYANTQNKVLATDLVSNSPIHIKIERLSKEISVPQKVGELYSTKWFYERVRGSYKSLFAYKSAPEKNRLDKEYPRTQLIEKTDLAKFEFSFDGRPDYVSLGAQKCFHIYTSNYIKLKREADFNETWFKGAVAKAILFRRLDREIAQSEWYKNDKGLKAQTVTYTIAACAQAFRDSGYQIDLMKIWKDQDVSSPLMKWILDQATIVHKILINPPPSDRNPAQFCKRDYCWSRYVKGKVGKPSHALFGFGVHLSDIGSDDLSSKSYLLTEMELDFDVTLERLAPKASEIRKLAESKRLISVNNSKALEKLESGKFNFTKTDKNSLRNLLDRLNIKY